MFLGHVSHSIDEKGRLIIPSKYREEIGSQDLVVFPGFSGQLVVYTKSDFAVFSSDLKNLKSSNPKEMEIRRFITTNCNMIKPDPQGRILLSQDLRNAAGIVKEVVITGNLDNFEIWNPERWKEVSNFGDGHQMQEKIEAMGLRI